MDFPGKPGLQGGGHGRADQSCVTVAPVPCAPHGHGCALMGWTPAVLGRLGMWDGQGRVCCSLCWWQLLGCTWKDLAPSPALTVLGAAQPCQPSWLLSAQILGSQGFSLTEAPGGVLSHPWPTADPASRHRAVHFWVFPWFYCISSLQDMAWYFSRDCFSLSSIAGCPWCVFDG